MFHTVLLAGDRPGDALAQISPGGRKALLVLQARPMILHVLETLLVTGAIGRITIVANNVADIADHPEVAAFLGPYVETGRVDFREGAGSPAGSVMRVVEEMKISEAVLITTADNPLLSADTLTQFCAAAARETDLDAAVGLAREADIRHAFPASRRTFIRLGGEGYSGCNLFALMPGTGAKAAAAWQKVEKRRKKPWQFILHFGVLTLIRALVGRLDLTQAMAAVSRTIGLRAKAIVLNDAVAAMDVDRVEHIAMAEDVLAKRKGGVRATAP